MFDMFGGSATRHECDRQICRHKNTHVQHNIAINMFQLQPRQNVVSIRYLILYWAVGEYNVRFQIKISRRSTNNSAISRKRQKIALQLLWNANRNSYAIYQMVPFPMTLDEP